jgi:hypothetical protein
VDQQPCFFTIGEPHPHEAVGPPHADLGVAHDSLELGIQEGVGPIPVDAGMHRMARWT